MTEIKSHNRQYGYREAETIVVIFITNLPHDILFYFISWLRFPLPAMFWETSFSCKVVTAQPKYRSLSSKPSSHGLLLTTYAIPLWRRISTWSLPIAAFCSNCAPHAYLVSNTEPGPKIFYLLWVSVLSYIVLFITVWAFILALAKE